MNRLDKLQGMAGRTAASPLLTFGLLLLSQLFSLRVEWFWYLFQVSFVPITYMVFVWFVWNDPGANVFVVTGSLVASVSLGAMLSLGQYLGWLRETRAYEYYAALPVSKGMFIAAIATRGVLLCTPALVVVAMLGSWLFGVQVTAISVLALLLSAYGMSGLGILVGFLSRTGHSATIATQILQAAIVFFAPVYVPWDRLPAFLRFTAQLMPTTYAAHGLRAAAASAPMSQLIPDLAVLAVFAVVSLLIVPYRIEWRER